uniref:BTB domain-containing protein n=1 Tax=Panagrolaimus sp. JU765 TaxID=591449 RepID=A0AC34R297_9BILA
MTFHTTQSFQTHILKEVFDVHNRYNGFKEKIGTFDDFTVWIECRKCADAEDHVSLFFHTNFPVSVFVGMKCQIANVKKSLFYTFDPKNQYCGWSKFGTTHELFVGGYMKIDWVVSLESNSGMVKYLKESAPHEKHALVDDGRFKQFTLCVEEKEIKVQKHVLVAASSVFANLLKNTHDEKTIISGHNYETVQAAVYYMHTNRIQLGTPPKTVLDLYEFAREYKLHDPNSILDWFNSEDFMKPIPPPRPPRESDRVEVKLPEIAVDDNKNVAKSEYVQNAPRLEIVAWKSKSELITHIPEVQTIKTRYPENPGAPAGGFGLLLMTHFVCLLVAIGFSLGNYFH